MLMKNNNGIQTKLRCLLMCVLTLTLITVSNISARAETTTNDSITETSTYSIDSEKPVIDRNSVTLSATSVTVGDSVKVSVKITDNVGVSRADVCFYNVDAGRSTKCLPLSYNTTTGLYEYSFTITDTTAHGHWYVDYIHAYDFVDNSATLSFWLWMNKPLFVVSEKNEDVHTWSDGYVLEQPTCSKTGIRKYVCIRDCCNASKTEIIEIDSNNHTGETEIKGYINPTCEKEGYSGDTYCKSCGNKIANGDLIPAHGHCLLENVIKDSSCTEKGIAQFVCTLCSYKTEEDLPSKGHEFINLNCIRCGMERTGKWISSGTKWWYRFEDSSYLADGFFKVGNAWYGFDSSGWMQTGWVLHEGSWYYFAENGVMQTGWQNINGNWYYMNGSGAMLTGWQNINGNWYYMNSWGAMLTGWQHINGNWYYMNDSGAMLTGWQYINGNWYYMNSGGAMLTGWQHIGGKWYYFYSGGNMAANTWIDNYYVNSSGVWV